MASDQSLGSLAAAINVVGPVIQIQPCMVSPSIIQVVETAFSNDSGTSNNGQDTNMTQKDVLKITPSIVIGQVVGQNTSAQGGHQESSGDTSSQEPELVLAIIPKSLECYSVINVRQAEPGSLEMSHQLGNQSRERAQILLKKPEYVKSNIAVDSTLVYPLSSVTTSSNSQEWAAQPNSQIKVKPTRTDLAQIVSTMSPALQMYSLLHYQLAINKFRVKSCLILTDSSSISSQKTLILAFLAIQILEKTIGIQSSSICCCTDNYNVQKTLKEKFPRISVMFAPTAENFTQLCFNQTNGLGFDLVIDFSMSHSDATSRKREVISALGVMGIWACMASQFQMDPPEAFLMTQKRITMAMFGNETSFIDSRLYDGAMQTIVQDIVSRVISGELTLVQAPHDDPTALQSHQVVTPKDLFMNQHEVSQMMLQAQQEPVTVAVASGRASIDDPAAAEKDQGATVPITETDSHGAVSEESNETQGMAPLVTGMNCIWLPTIDLMQ